MNHKVGHSPTTMKSQHTEQITYTMTAGSYISRILTTKERKAHFINHNVNDIMHCPSYFKKELLK